MSNPIALLRDDFEDNIESPAWGNAYVVGSATKAETTGQARFTLPSSTAGSHDAAYQSSATYDLTADSCFITIGTMVATGVAATAYFQLIDSATSNYAQWTQTSGTLKAQTVVSGVPTDRYSVAWSATTYKYLRIRESGGNLLFDSSTNGTSWTNRATLATPISLTSLIVKIGASCGNIASPGSFRLDEFNSILPVPSATWRETTADWSITNRFRPVTLASDGGKRGVIVTADAMDSSRVLSGNVRYFAGPLGSISGGYLALTEYASLALAQASAFPIPVNGRVDLPYLIDARYMRLYHQSIDASAHSIYEYVPRRIVQADDIEAESIRAINISAGAVTADKIFVLQLSAITANIGGLNIDLTGYLWQGTGTAAAPTTGLKIFNSGGIGKLSTYNATVEQITLDTDGKFKWGAGAGVMDAGGVRIIQGASVVDLRSLALVKADGTTVIGRYGGGYATSHGLFIEGTAISGEQSFVDVTARAGTTDGAVTTLRAVSGTAAALITLTSDGTTPTIALSASGGTTISGATGGLSVGTTGAGAGQIATSGSVGFGIAPAATARMYVRGAGNTSATTGIYLDNSSGTATFYIQNDGDFYIGASGSQGGFFGSTGATKPTVTGSRGANAALASLLTALASLGLLTDSST